MFKLKKKRLTDNVFVDDSKAFFHWLQEFSKKIVTVTFIIFVIVNIYILIMVYLSFLNSGDVLYLDTLITETNETFRNVIGGYIIKAATENIIKIGGSYVKDILDKKLSDKYGIIPSEVDLAPSVPESVDDPEFKPTEEDYPEDELSAANSDEY